MESHYVADNCAEYLKKFYILPHAYEVAFARRVIASILVMGFVALLMVTCALAFFPAVRHPQPTGHGKFGVLLFCIVGVLAILFSAIVTKSKLVISHDAIEATGAFSKTKILASNVLGYAADYIYPIKGRTGKLQFFIVHRALGQQETRTRIYFDPNDLTDTKLQGLFRSMHNYGSEDLDHVLIEVNEGKFTMENMFTVAIISGSSIFMLWHFIPLIKSIL